MSYLVFTDLDGTLLNHDDYSFEAALPAIRRLEKLSIPIIPVSSKTRAEIIPLREALQLTSPFIVENGAAIFIPKDCQLVVQEPLKESDGYLVKEFSPDHRFWVGLVDELQLRWPGSFKPFNQMSLDDIVDLTGLPVEQANLSAQREYSNPLFWYGNERQLTELKKYCEQKEVTVTKGGRFVHLLKGADKGQAVSWLKAALDPAATSIALGDGENDVAMLAVADRPVQIRSDHHDFPSFFHAHLYQTKETGATGWREAIDTIIT